MKRVKDSMLSEGADPRVRVSLQILQEASPKSAGGVLTDRDLRSKIAETTSEMFGKLGLLRFEINSLAVSPDSRSAQIGCPRSQVPRLRLLLFFVTHLQGHRVRLRIAGVQD